LYAPNFLITSLACAYPIKQIDRGKIESFTSSLPQPTRSICLMGYAQARLVIRKLGDQNAVFLVLAPCRTNLHCMHPIFLSPASLVHTPLIYMFSQIRNGIITESLHTNEHVKSSPLRVHCHSQLTMPAFETDGILYSLVVFHN
jgi:hypothetical protein